MTKAVLQCIETTETTEIRKMWNNWTNDFDLATGKELRAG